MLSSLHPSCCVYRKGKHNVQSKDRAGGQAFDVYFDLASRLNRSPLERSEADLTRPFLAMLEVLGLHAVLDTGQHTSRRKRPDILAYVNRDDADLAYPAQVVGEVKPPDEIRGLGGSVQSALMGALWADKFVPYVRANAARMRHGRGPTVLYCRHLQLHVGR